jgi:hypothetical protein
MAARIRVKVLPGSPEIPEAVEIYAEGLPVGRTVALVIDGETIGQAQILQPTFEVQVPITGGRLRNKLVDRGSVENIIKVGSFQEPVLIFWSNGHSDLELRLGA